MKADMNDYEQRERSIDAIQATHDLAQQDVCGNVPPPIGLRPEKAAIHQQARDRLLEIAEAMTRYSEAGRVVPVQWCIELERRVAGFTRKIDP